MATMRIPLLALVVFGLIGPANADGLRAGGLGATTQLLPALLAGLGEKAGTFEVVPSLGSSGGLRALAAGALDIAVSGRPLGAEELRLGMRVVATMRTPFVLVTSNDKPGGLKSAEIAELFRSAKSTWPDGSTVRAILRPKSDSDTPILGGMFPGMASALEAARARHDVPVAATDQDNADAAERIPGSLAGSTFTQIKTERRPLRLLPIDGVAPSLQALESGAYPFSKNIYFVLPAAENPAAASFVAFLRSPAGRAILRDGGSLMISDPNTP
jgi:phosphate transport system substrate-binding protein